MGDLADSDTDPDRVGPYTTADDAAADCRIVNVQADRDEVTAGQAAYDRLAVECGRLDVALGTYDRLGLWDVAERLGPEHAQVVYGLLNRAYQSGLDAGGGP